MLHEVHRNSVIQYKNDQNAALNLNRYNSRGFFSFFFIYLKYALCACLMEVLKV